MQVLLPCALLERCHGQRIAPFSDITTDKWISYQVPPTLPNHLGNAPSRPRRNHHHCFGGPEESIIIIIITSIMPLAPIAVTSSLHSWSSPLCEAFVTCIRAFMRWGPSGGELVHQRPQLQAVRTVECHRGVLCHAVVCHAMQWCAMPYHAPCHTMHHAMQGAMLYHAMRGVDAAGFRFGDLLRGECRARVVPGEPLEGGGAKDTVYPLP